MAKRIKHKFPSEHEEELISLLETYGSFADLDMLADYFGVSRYALSGFLNTKKAEDAKSRYLPGTKEAMFKHAHLRPTEQELALPDTDEMIVEDNLWSTETPIQPGELSLLNDYKIAKKPLRTNNDPETTGGS